MRCAIIIVTYNCLIMIKATLAHLMRNTKFNDSMELIIIDNNSEDGTKEYLQDKLANDRFFSNICLNNENMGFGIANTQGVDIAKSLGCERVILLNPDTMPFPGWYKAIHETMDIYNNENDKIHKYNCIFHCGIVGAKLLDYTDPDRIVHGGTYWNYKEGLHLVGRKSNGDYNEDKLMHWVTGAVMLIDLKCWDDCGGMQPFYFYGQDSMLCFMAWHHGWCVMYSSKCEVRHYEGYSMRQADRLVLKWKTQKQNEEGQKFKILFNEYYRDEY